MGITCRCGYNIPKEYGYFELRKDGRYYKLYYCCQCHSDIAKNRDNNKLIYYKNIKEL